MISKFIEQSQKIAIEFNIIPTKKQKLPKFDKFFHDKTNRNNIKERNRERDREG